MRTWEQSKHRSSNEKLPCHDSHDDKNWRLQTLQGWSFKCSNYIYWKRWSNFECRGTSNTSCSTYLWASGRHFVACEICRVKLVKQEFSWKSSAEIASPTSPFETTHRSGIAVFVWLHGTIGGPASLCKKAHVKGRTQKQKKTYTNIAHVSLSGFFYFLPQSWGFCWFFFHTYFGDKQAWISMFFFHHARWWRWWTTWAHSNRALFEHEFKRCWATSNLPRTRLAVQHHPDVEGFHKIHNQRVLRCHRGHVMFLGFLIVIGIILFDSDSIPLNHPIPNPTMATCHSQKGFFERTGPTNENQPQSAICLMTSNRKDLNSYTCTKTTEEKWRVTHFKHTYISYIVL